MAARHVASPDEFWYNGTHILSTTSGDVATEAAWGRADVITASPNGSSRYFHLMMGVWLPGVTCMVGMAGNILSLVVLSLDRSHCPTFYSLRALALSDVVLLLAGLLQQVVPLYYEMSGCDINFCRIKGYVRVYSWPVICMAQMSSMWLTVLISAERYLAICFPFQSVRVRSIPRVRLGIIIIMASSVIYNLPRFFEFRTVGEFSPEHNITMAVLSPTDLRHNLVYRYLYNTALYCLVLYAIPFIILSFLNFKIIAEMRNATAQWETLNRKQQRELKATIMPLCVVIVFIICATQSLATFVLDAIFVDTSEQRWLQNYFAVVNLMVLLNSAINFLLFYLFGRKFRYLLRRVLTCQRCRAPAGRALSRFDWRNRPIQ